MKPIIRCSNCESDLRFGQKSCPKCGESVEWPGGVASEGGGKRQGRTREDHGRKPSGAGLSSTGKIVTGIAIVVVGGAVVLELLTGSKNQPTGQVGTSTPQFQVPAMGQTGPNQQAASQLADLENRVRQNPGDHDFLLQVANFAHDNGYYDKSISYYDQYLRHHPEDVNAIVDKGICYHELGKSEQAIEVMNQALKLQPNHLLANFNLGIVNLKMGNLEKANGWFKKVVALDPNSDIGKSAQELLAPHANLPAQ